MGELRMMRLVLHHHNLSSCTKRYSWRQKDRKATLEVGRL